MSLLLVTVSCFSWRYLLTFIFLNTWSIVVLKSVSGKSNIWRLNLFLLSVVSFNPRHSVLLPCDFGYCCDARVLKNIICGESPRLRIKAPFPEGFHLLLPGTCIHYCRASLRTEFTALGVLGFLLCIWVTSPQGSQPTGGFSFASPLPAQALQPGTALYSPPAVGLLLVPSHTLRSRLITEVSPIRFLSFGNLEFLYSFETLKSLSKIIAQVCGSDHQMSWGKTAPRVLLISRGYLSLMVWPGDSLWSCQHLDAFVNIFNILSSI